MPRDQRNVNVAALTDGLAVVHGFKNGEQPRVFLHQSRECIEIARADVRSECAPLWRSGARRANRSVNVSSTALSDCSQLLAIRRIECVEIFSSRGRLPCAVDEESEAAAVALQPCDRFLRNLRERVRIPC